MRRRDFIAGAVTAGAMVRGAQGQQAKAYRIAFAVPSDPVSDLMETGGRPHWRAYLQRLRELGYAEGQNVTIERHSGQGRTEKFAELAREIARSKPDLIFVMGDRLTKAVRAATDVVPIVSVVGDPVASGVASNLARPDSNVTGVTVNAGPEFVAKYVELLHEMVPAASRVAWLASPMLWDSSYAATLREASLKFDISFIGPPLETPFDEPAYRRAFTAFLNEEVGAVNVGSQPENLTNRHLIVELASEAKLPTIYPYPEFAAIGGLMAFGVDLSDIFRHAAVQSDMILRGTRLSEIPFYQPTKFTLVINLKSANALGIAVPPTLLIAADEVIE